MSSIKVPGVLYSIILALAAWGLDYFATAGQGGNYIFAPLILAGIPILLKIASVATGDEQEPEVTARGMGGVQPRGKVSKVLFG